MTKKEKNKPYKIIGAYDTETTNHATLKGIYAFPILHQIGLISPDLDLRSITADNVEDLSIVSLYRSTKEAYKALDDVIELGLNAGFVPVVMVHNLSFDMYSLAQYLNNKNVRPLAKSNTKPISFTIIDESGKPCLVFWDTLGFFGKPLGLMGRECGYTKSNKWDYNKVRTPETILSNDELEYAKRDIFALFAYVGYYLRSNPLIQQEDLGRSIVTKTGAVRAKRKTLFNSLKGKTLKRSAGQYWNYQNRQEQPKTDDELYTMNACTRGGFTFCAGASAGIPFNLDNTNKVILGYDATSQHPAQMVSHLYPEKFHEATPEQLSICCDIIALYDVKAVLKQWQEPFSVAFNGLFEFTNLRLKQGSIFEKNNISPLAWARVRDLKWANDDNESNSLFKNMIEKNGYKDKVENDCHSFGKITSCNKARLYLTELAFWELTRAFEWDKLTPISGYMTSRFCKPTDFSILSVMQFYKNKDTFKHFKELYDKREPLVDTLELRKICSSEFVDSMENQTADDNEVKAQYQIFKSDLNALFGIECTNEARADQILNDVIGIETLEPQGIDDMPKSLKTWYKFGQRIVGWSRIAQICIIELSESYIDAIINGDTDSIKMLVNRENIVALNASIDELGKAIDKAKKNVCSRIEREYPQYFVPLEKIGWYECEFETTRFCASWNKSYVIQEFDKRKGCLTFKFTIAGVPTSYGERSYNAFADYLYHEKGWSFEQVCSLMLGYNVTITNNITGLNGRKIPAWGRQFEGVVTDYQGKETFVSEPMALAIYPMSKTIGAFESEDNFINWQIACKNNKSINSNPVLLDWEKGEEPEIIYL